MTDNPRRHKSFKPVKQGNIPEAKATTVNVIKMKSDFLIVPVKIFVVITKKETRIKLTYKMKTFVPTATSCHPLDCILKNNAFHKKRF
jgi:hypothetical protein